MVNPQKFELKFLLSLIPYLIIFITFIKILFVVFSSPIMGYGNNYDFLRQSSCTGLWQQYSEKSKTSTNPDAPVNSLIYDKETLKKVCMHSVDNLFSHIAVKFHSVGEKLDFREISLWKIAFLLSSIVILISLSKDFLSKMTISLSFFLVFGDIANLLYSNTLYMEFSVILGCYFSLLLIILIITSNNFLTKKIILLFVFFSLFLGASKQQYMPFAAFLAFTLAIYVFFRWHIRKLSFIMLLISIAIPAIYAQLNKENSGHMRGINFANKTDTFLWAVLPAATDKSVALDVLGLPKKCLAGIGKSWYSPGLQGNHPCPEVENTSRIKLLKLFVLQPNVFFQPIYQAIPGIYPFYPSYLGHTENPSTLNSSEYYLYKITSLSHILMLLSIDSLNIILPVLMIVGVYLFVVYVVFNNRSSNRLSYVVIGFGGVLAIYAVLSSVFGDGYVELQKHAVAFLIGISFQITGFIIMVISNILVNLKIDTLRISSAAYSLPTGKSRDRA